MSDKTTGPQNPSDVHDPSETPVDKPSQAEGDVGDAGEDETTENPAPNAV